MDIKKESSSSFPVLDFSNNSSSSSSLSQSFFKSKNEVKGSNNPGPNSSREIMGQLYASIRQQNLIWMEEVIARKRDEALEKGRTCYEQKDYKGAAEAFTQVESNWLSAEEQFFLANCYHKGEYGVVQNQNRAFQLYLSAAENGHAKAAFYVAAYYEEGRAGVTVDKKKALDWYKLAFHRDSSNQEAKNAIEELLREKAIDEVRETLKNTLSSGSRSN